MVQNKTQQEAPGEYPFDEEEREIMEAMKADKLKPLKGKEREEKLNEVREAAENTHKTRPVTIRLPEADIARMKSIAADKGLPYQTYIRSLIHQHARQDVKED